jgi:hypothetical protein
MPGCSFLELRTEVAANFQLTKHEKGVQWWAVKYSIPGT